jgi:molecular chaperone GrpE
MSDERRFGQPGAPEQPAEEGPNQDHAAGVDAGEDEARVEADLDQLLDETKRERDEYLDLARRTKADFENFRRRANSAAEEAGRRGKASLAKQLVPVLDNLERALRAAGIDPESDDSPAERESPDAASEDGGGLGHGVRLVYRELRAALAGAGVEDYDPRGERFDPEWHEALATRTEAGTEPGVVVETLEKGYRLDRQVLRAARVVVSE